jgi:hypothetical protein
MSEFRYHEYQWRIQKFKKERVTPKIANNISYLGSQILNFTNINLYILVESGRAQPLVSKIRSNVHNMHTQKTITYIL